MGVLRGVIEVTLLLFLCFSFYKRSIKKCHDVNTVISALIHKANQCEVCQCKLDWPDPQSAFLVLYRQQCLK